MNVSCPAAGQCVADGLYVDAGNRIQATVLAEAAGTWSVADAPAPANAGVSTSVVSDLASLSCGAGACVAGGEYADTSGKLRGLIERYSGGAWSATEAPEPGNAGTGTNQFAAILRPVVHPRRGLHGRGGLRGWIGQQPRPGRHLLRAAGVGRHRSARPARRRAPG